MHVIQVARVVNESNAYYQLEKLQDSYSYIFNKIIHYLVQDFKNHKVIYNRNDVGSVFKVACPPLERAWHGFTTEANSRRAVFDLARHWVELYISGVHSYDPDEEYKLNSIPISRFVKKLGTYVHPDLSVMYLKGIKEALRLELKDDVNSRILPTGATVRKLKDGTWVILFYFNQDSKNKRCENDNNKSEALL